MTTATTDSKPTTRPTVRPPLPETHVDVALGDLNDVCGLIRMGPSWLHNEVREGRFPQPLRFGPRCVRWQISQVRAWLIERAEKAAADTEIGAQLKARATDASAKAKLIRSAAPDAGTRSAGARTAMQPAVPTLPKKAAADSQVAEFMTARSTRTKRASAKASAGGATP